MRKKTKSAAKLSIRKPGAMTKKGRRDIAKWLRRQAEMFEKDGHVYTDKGWFVGRYLYV